jgi:integrase
MHKSKPALVAPSRGLEDLIAKTRNYMRGATSPATVRAYQSDFADFVHFCRDHNLASLPATPTTVALYISDRASVLANATITRRLTAITKAHQAFGCTDSPASSHHFVVSETLKGIRRAIGTAQQGKDALLTSDIRKMVEHCPHGLRGLRDRALLLVGFAGAFRRSELASLEVADLTFTPEGLVINLRRSKTDQEAKGREVGIPFGADELTCTVRSLKSWLTCAQIDGGPVFRSVGKSGRLSHHALSPDSVAWIIREAARRAGFKGDVSGHSLRSGHVTTAARAGVSELVIMRTTGHRSVTTLRKYIRKGELFVVNGASKLGL